MLNIILEIVSTVLFGILFFSFLKKGKKENLSNHRGWTRILIGFGLLFLSGLIDISDEFPSLSRYIILGPTLVRQLLEKILGYTLGSIFLFIGFMEWIPYITKSLKMEKELKNANEHLEARIAERTKELTESNVKLKDADRVQSMFLANMSHELRTPLNAIIGFSGLMLMGIGGKYTKEQKKQLGLIKESGNHLKDLIDDILDIAKIEAGKLEVQHDEVHLSELLNKIIEKYKPIAEQKDIKIQQDINWEGIIVSDHKRLKLVINNVVNNAIKFTEKGGVKVELQPPNDSYLKIRIIDTGTGIKNEDFEKIFKFFQQLDMTSTKREQGTGLGLYLSKKVMNILGGDILVESKFNRGSTFSILVPEKYKE
jgi:signal transduction histidine kinase